MNRISYIYAVLFFTALVVNAQNDTIYLSLDQALEIANDSSLQAFKSRNLYMVSYWNYENYQSQKLPHVTLSTTPFEYSRGIERKWNDSLWVYSHDKYFSSNGNIRVNQKLPFTGGSLYLNSRLNRFENLGKNRNITYNSTIVSLGYSQPVFGFNEFKWQRKTAPLQYEIARMEYIQSREEINLKIIPLFFTLADAELSFKIAQQNFATADTLYKIGQERFILASIDRGDLLTLKLDRVNAENNLIRSESNYSRARDALINFLRLETESCPYISLPEVLPKLKIDAYHALKLAKENNPFYLDLENQLLNANKKVERTKIESRFSANLDANIGYNQSAPEIQEAYRNPSEKQYFQVSFSVPILDWGERKSRYYVALNEHEVTKISTEQNRQDFEQDMLRLISDFNLQSRIVKSTKEASNIALESYEINKQRFIMGRIDVNTLGLQQTKKDNALRTYLSELEKFWNYYYTIRKLTLHDYENQKPLEESFDQELFKP